MTSIKVNCRQCRADSFLAPEHVLITTRTGDLGGVAAFGCPACGQTNRIDVDAILVAEMSEAGSPVQVEHIPAEMFDPLRSSTEGRDALLDTLAALATADVLIPTLLPEFDPRG